MAVAWRNTHLLDWLNTYLEIFEFHKDIDSLIQEYPEIYAERKRNTVRIGR
jgi:hypothetical protein